MYENLINIHMEYSQRKNPRTVWDNAVFGGITNAIYFSLVENPVNKSPDGHFWLCLFNLETV